MAGTSYDFAGLEEAEFAACIDFYRAAPEGVRAGHAIDVREVAAATCFTCRGLDPPSVFRRAVRLGVRSPASEAELDEVLAHMTSLSPAHVVTAAPLSQPAALASWLERRAYTRGWAWMKFSRRCDTAPGTESGLDVRVIDTTLGAEFGRVTTEGFGMPASVAPWLAALAGRKNWICVMAFIDGEPIAAGAAYVRGEYAWLGFGTTVASQRRHGAQNALLALRLNEAAARGARIAVTETGERVPDRPSNSYRNILRAGFEEMYVRQNYMSSLRSPDAR